VPQTRPYDSLRAKGEDRKQRILDVAQRLLTRNGWRNTTLAQIAGEAGVSPAGLLHHFESKEQLLHAVLDARDADDDAHADRAGDLISEVAAVADRFYRSPTACCWPRTSTQMPRCTTVSPPAIRARSTSSPCSFGGVRKRASSAWIWM
jgi:AcrR family transcriptional regulator